MMTVRNPTADATNRCRARRTRRPSFRMTSVRQRPIGNRESRFLLVDRARNDEEKVATRGDRVAMEAR